ncbi:DUF6193 family natural product biosynthesis protein [Streptomyces sp. NPDC020681]|uniref:DUF6193 family natural product biosynthesis protein n=1 Tax=Streptomyces sp. NPDC020681 TaxID=3365083 RepID=UPI0037B8111D
MPYIQPAAEGASWVSGPFRTETVGPAATAQDAIAMVIERLPAGCGPAFVGTLDELAAHETTMQQSQTYRGKSQAEGRGALRSDDYAGPLLGAPEPNH